MKTAIQLALASTTATVLEALDRREHSGNFARAIRLGGAVVCHCAAHRASKQDREPSLAEQWVAYWNGEYQGVWYHRELFERFLKARGWEIDGANPYEARE